MMRFGIPLVLLVASAAGFLSGVGACGEDCDERGVYGPWTIVDTLPSDTSPLIGGEVRREADNVVITYMRDDGLVWTVTYVITDKEATP